MAVTISKTSAAEYMLSGGSIGGCIGGGEDYRTVSRKGGTTSDSLFIRGWAGDNISNACKIITLKIEGLEAKVTLTTGTVTSASLKLMPTIVSAYGSVSGTTFNIQTNNALGIAYSTLNVDSSNNWKSYNFASVDVEKYHSQYPENFIANKSYLGVKLDFKNNSSLSLRGYLRKIKISAVRTRACYITFQGNGVTTTKTMYDYGSTPSYGSTPTKTGYKFKGWKSSATGSVYTGTLPTAYEQDVTYTAVFEKLTYAITASAGEGGTISPSGETTVSHGNSQTYTITPNAGYEIDTVTVDGVNKGAVGSFTFSNVTSAHTISVTFKQIPTYYLDLNGMLDGVSSGGISPYGTADVYINGVLTSDNCGDFWTAYPAGTTYEIKDIKANDGYQYDGVHSGTLSGTITGTTNVVLSFSTKKINRIYSGISNAKSVWVSTSELKGIYVGVKEL